MASRRSSIGYADFSGGDANFIIGCTPVSEGCLRCYARDLIEVRQGRDFSEVRLYPKKLARLNRAKFEENGVPFRRGPGSRPIVFPVDLGDIMHKDVPYDFIQPALWTMENRSDVDWLILTKRAARLLEFYPDGWPENIWPGVTVENNTAAWRANYLIQVRASVRWLSLEPMLEAIDLDGCLGDLIQLSDFGGHVGDGLEWIVVGGESGNNRRPFDPDWARQAREDCKNKGVPFFYKQGSHRFPGRNDVLDGRTWKEFPR